MLRSDLVKISDVLWEIPKSYRADMRVPVRVFATEEMLNKIFEDKTLEQAVNVSTLPGIVGYSYVMPDAHEGYGMPIGGVAATELPDGVISPGSVGYDVNCGVRLLISGLSWDEMRPKIAALANQMMRDVPSGVGRGGIFKFGGKEMNKLLTEGVPYLVSQGYGMDEDIERIESGGNLEDADPSKVSDRAKKRGNDQVGTLGSGNHFLEVQKVDEIFDIEKAKIFGLEKDQVTVMIHTGSRGFGHQICSDYAARMLRGLSKYNIRIPDRELSCAPFNSPEGQDYFGAMTCAANYAWANRQMITYIVRGSWDRAIGGGALKIVYDVAHNLGKREAHEVSGKQIEVLVHRKGATRAFGPGAPGIPEMYKETGQPVLIPGSMGTASYVLAGTEEAMKVSFGTTCHGAGRTMSRKRAKQQVQGGELKRKLESQGIIVRCDSASGLAEEAPIAYKDIDEVVEVVSRAGIAEKVARLKPVAVIKGG